MAQQDESTQQPQAADVLPPYLSAVQSLYCNGFEIGMGTSDVFVVVAQNGRRTLLLNLSYTTAKTLAGALMEVVHTLEAKSGREIMTVSEVTNYLMTKEAPKP